MAVGEAEGKGVDDGWAVVAVVTVAEGEGEAVGEALGVSVSVGEGEDIWVGAAVEVLVATTAVEVGLEAAFPGGAEQPLNRISTNKNKRTYNFMD